MTDRELMQEALYALTYVGDAKEIYSDTIESLRARLAQPEQEPIKYEEWNYDPMTGKPLWGEQPEPEPVAWADKYDLDREGHDFWVSRQQPAKNGVPLYTAPSQREWQGLTDEEIEKLYLGSFDEGQFARAIEAKLKEKNT